MRYVIATAATAFVMLLLSGCGVERVAIDPVGYKSVSQGEEITPEQADRVVDGKTTKDEVYLMFGEPSSTLEDGRVFVYDWVRGGEGNVLGFGSDKAVADHDVHWIAGRQPDEQEDDHRHPEHNGYRSQNSL